MRSFFFFFLPIVLACGARSSIPGGASVTCATPTPASLPTPPTPPNVVGCYADENGAWVRIPCNCEVPVDNTSGEPQSVRFTLDSDVAPSLTGSPDVEITFDDTDGTWLDAWTNQSGAGHDFVVTNANARTTVRLGTKSVTLDTVEIAACQSGMAQASVDGADAGSTLKVHVASTNDRDSADGSCVVMVKP